MPSYIKEAVTCFKNKDYKNAMKFYEQAAKEYGAHLFEASILLCKKRLNGHSYSSSSILKTIDIKQLEEQLVNLKRQVKEKDKNIEERFEEIAILTRMLEEK
ncbi:hypothetical protein [Vibrio metschnikovii]|uniref:hypothetical protein n=1 Tax=Vibrio metschnikovii TaxID=28172 RepID=UPI0013021544|nr:hypothetical protein [Vibrio metschnikovii]EKO3621462.1 hypothetical protein [Vibrio metschnikovii]EKO3625594.1 hypothetical protein [Vibrio metschnikovii]